MEIKNITKSFLDELVELEQIENSKKKKKYKHLRICKVCKKKFDHKERRLSCSEECRLILLSRAHSGYKPNQGSKF